MPVIVISKSDKILMKNKGATHRDMVNWSKCPVEYGYPGQHHFLMYKNTKLMKYRPLWPTFSLR